MALNNFKCNHLMPIHFEGLTCENICTLHTYTAVTTDDSQDTLLLLLLLLLLARAITQLYSQLLLYFDLSMFVCKNVIIFHLT